MGLLCRKLKHVGSDNTFEGRKAGSGNKIPVHPIITPAGVPYFRNGFFAQTAGGPVVLQKAFRQSLGPGIFEYRGVEFSCGFIEILAY